MNTQEKKQDDIHTSNNYFRVAGAALLISLLGFASYVAHSEPEVTHKKDGVKNIDQHGKK